MKHRIFLPGILILLFTSCKDQSPGKSHGAFVLGDSSTIVTETDPSVLLDQVTDLQPKPEVIDETPVGTEADTVAAPEAQATNTESAPAVSVSSFSGLRVPFKDVVISIVGIKTRSYGHPDLQTARGATYELSSGKLSNAQMNVDAAVITKVSQRYETILQLKDGSDELPLESLGKYSSEWRVLNGTKGNYKISGIDDNDIEFRDVSASAVRNAVQAAARKKRLSKSDTRDWLDIARKFRSVDKRPADIVLRSVMWRIEGKDAAGKTFNKELRIDLPVR